MREVTWGTPSRSPRYQQPRGSVLLLVALGGALVVAGSFLAAEAVGAHAALSPGPVSSAHAPMATSCAECHAERQGVASARCERCHDPAGAKNLSHAAHVLAASPAARAVRPAAELACDRCHREHEGRDARIAVVSSFECAQCHFRSFSVHPDFAVVRERRGERPGLRFDHAAHVGLLMDVKGGGGSATCTRCHEPSPENRDFLPLSFEAHCAECHELGAGVRHRDPRIVSSWHALRRRLDAAGYERERDALLLRIAQLRERLSRIGQAAPGSQAPPPVLTLGARKQVEKAALEAEAELRVLAGDSPAEAAPAEATHSALAALIAPCRSCHVPDQAGAFVRVRGAQHILKGAAFVHAPHLRYSDCARCHASIARSTQAEELHLEGIATCRGCHATQGVREDCQHCHRYHPRGAW